MEVTNKMARLQGRVFDILEGIDRSIGESRAFELIGEDGTFAVPFRLRRAIARTALHMLQEGRRAGGDFWKKGKTQSEIDAIEAKIAAGRAGMAAGKKKRKRKRREKQAQDLGLEGSKKAEFLAKSDLRRRPKKKKKKKKAAAAAPKDRDDGAPPPPPAAGAAQAVEGGPTDARKKADARTARKIKKKLTLPSGDIPADPRRRGKKKLAGKALEVSMKARRKKGRPEVASAPDVDEKVAALGRAREKLKRVGAGREQRHAPPGMPRGRRRRMIGPEDEDPSVQINYKNVLGRIKGFINDQGRGPNHDEIRDMERRERKSVAGRRIGLPSEFKAHRARKEKDLEALEKERQRRSRGVPGRVAQGPVRPFEGRPRVGKIKAGLGAKAGKLARMRGRHRLLRNRDHDAAKGYDVDEPRTTGPSADWKGHSKDPDSGEVTHSSGKKENKKFANSHTFRSSDDDAMLHTDKSRKGSRGSADSDEFVFTGNTDEDPRNKWYRVSKEGGYASAMASLGKSYHKSKAMRQKVIDKVKSTGFVDSEGHQINVRPTGAMHNERGACVRKPGPKDSKGRPKIDPATGKPIKGPLTAAGKALKRTDPGEFYRLCKGSHDGPGGTKKGRIEYGRGFDPQHDDASKVNRLHKAAEGGKAEVPWDNIKQHAAIRPHRRGQFKQKIRRVGASAERQG